MDHAPALQQASLRLVPKRGLGVCAGVLACLCLAVPANAAANTITANPKATSATSGDGVCSLTEAVAYANGTAEPDCSSAASPGIVTIDLPAGSYALPATLEFSHSTTLVGAGASTTTISGGGSLQPIHVDSTGSVSISGVTISGGVSGDSSSGCTGSGLLRNCPAEPGNPGGGVYNVGTLTLTNAVVSGNAASAGVLPYSLLFSLCLMGNCPGSAGDSAGGGGSGGGIYNEIGGSLVLDHTVVSDNTAGAGGNGTAGTSGTGSDASAGQNGGAGGGGGWGGGIYSAGTLTVIGSTISGNSAGAGGNAGAGSNATASGDDGGSAGSAGSGGWGGGIYASGTIEVSGSTISGNHSGDGGEGASGGSGNGGGTAGTSSSSANGAPGAGFYDRAPTGSLTNVTLAQNATGSTGTGGGTPSGNGGAIWDYGEPLGLSFVTIAGNSAGGGAAIGNSGTLTESNSVIGTNTAQTAGSTCSNALGTYVDGGHNLEASNDGSCPGTVGDPDLGALTSNGGPTVTMALASGSAAIGLVPVSACNSTTDQRGVARPHGSDCDAGAYQTAAPVIVSPAASASGTTGALIKAQITTNLTTTSVTVDYGTSTGYGSAAHTTLSGAAGASGLSVPIGGLKAGTTYHLKLVATNQDGSSSSGDFTVRTAAATATGGGTGSAGVSTKGAVVTLKLKCASGGAACKVKAQLTTHVTSRGKRVVALAARAPRAAGAKKVRRVTRDVTVAGGGYTLASGKGRTVKLTLNKTGRALLKTHHTLPATLKLTGAVKSSKRLKLK